MAEFGQRKRDAVNARVTRAVPAGAAAAVSSGTYQRSARAASSAAAPAARRDEGLRAYMTGVYFLMMLGVAFSGAISFFLVSQPALLKQIIQIPGFPLIIFFGTLGLSAMSGTIASSESPVFGHIMFWTYCALCGVGLAPCILFMTQAGHPEVVARAFFLASSMFAVATLYGYTTKTNLNPIGSFLCMLTWGLVAATVLNVFFMKTDQFGLILCYATVVIFAGVTAWETQEIKDSYSAADSENAYTSKSIFGAFQLYGSFMMLFSRLLRILYSLQSE